MLSFLLNQIWIGIYYILLNFFYDILWKQLLIHIGECRLSYCIDNNLSNSLQLFIVLFECWALTMTSKQSALLCILIISPELQNCLNSHWSNPSYWLIVVIAYHQWCSRDRDRDLVKISGRDWDFITNSETETRDLKFETETETSKCVHFAEILLKTVVTTSDFNFFKFLVIFRRVWVVFYLQIQQTKNR